MATIPIQSPNTPEWLRWLVGAPEDIVSIPIPGAPAITAATKRGVPKAAQVLQRLIEGGLEKADAAKVFLADLHRGSQMVPPATPISPPKGFSFGAIGEPQRAQSLIDIRRRQQEWLAQQPQAMTRPIQADRKSIRSVGSKVRHAKLSTEDVMRIRSMADAGIPLADILAHYNTLSRQAIGDVIHRRSFAGVK